jgi:predicted component of type VI protein secretion system
VRLSRLDALAGYEHYVLFGRAVLVGSDAACAVRIDHPSVAPVHAQVLHLGGSFWLEPLQHTRPTLCDGRPAPLDQLAPLRPASTIQLGDVHLAVLALQQYYVDVAAPTPSTR